MTREEAEAIGCKVVATWIIKHPGDDAPLGPLWSGIATALMQAVEIERAACEAAVRHLQDYEEPLSEADNAWNRACQEAADAIASRARIGGVRDDSGRG